MENMREDMEIEFPCVDEQSELEYNEDFQDCRSKKKLLNDSTDPMCPKSGYVPLIPLSFTVFPCQKENIVLSDKDLITQFIKKNEEEPLHAGVFLKRNDSDQREVVSSLSDLYAVGTLVKIEKVEYEDEKLRLDLTGVQRISLKGNLAGPLDGCLQDEPQVAADEVAVHSLWQNKCKLSGDTSQGEESKTPSTDDVAFKQTPRSAEKLLMAHVEFINDGSNTIAEELEALKEDIKKTVDGIIALDQEFKEKVMGLPDTKLDNWAYALAYFASAKPHELQLVLKENQTVAKFRQASILLDRKLKDLMNQCLCDMNAELKKKIFLLEGWISLHMKKEYLETLRSEACPNAVKDVVRQMVSIRNSKYEEVNKIENYLEMVRSIPWDVPVQENLDLEHANLILAENLIGLEGVKEKILGFIRDAEQKGTRKGPTLLIHGPRGSGKKSIGKAIARALDRECFILNFGIMTDVAELTGQGMTVDGGRPGNIIKSLRETGTMNPVVLLNAVDKACRQDASICNALRDLLVDAKKASFLDNYLGVSVDLSQVLFVWIVSDVNIIPEGLHNCFYNLEATGYFVQEKLEIAKRFLIPAARETMEIPADKLLIEDSAIKILVLNYCQELGITYLKTMIESIVKAKADQISQGQDEVMVVTEDDLECLLGKPKRQWIYETTPVGVARGLGYNADCSFAQYIEASGTPGEGNTDDITGNLGPNMAESVKVARNYATCLELTKFREHGRDPVLSKSRIHVHAPPMGEAPKDGPSAGIAIVTALISLCLQRPVRPNMAMTGEMSLLGDVLPVGGIRQKMIAAEQAGVTCIILPKGNEDDYNKLPRCFREGLEAHFVSHYEEVLPIAFPN